MENQFQSSTKLLSKRPRFSGYVYISAFALTFLYITIKYLNSAKQTHVESKNDSFDTLPADMDYHLDGLQVPFESNQATFSSGISRLTWNVMDEPWQPVTAILYDRNDVDDDALNLHLNSLLQLQYFKEIIVYQPLRLSFPTIRSNLIISHAQQQTSSGTVLVLKTKMGSVVRVLKSQGQPIDEMKTLSRYTLCSSLATYDTCFFQDVDSALAEVPLDALYLNYMRYPQLVHAIVPPEHYLDSQRWRFFQYNGNQNLHTGYSDVSYGLFVAKWRCQHFLTQLGKSGLGKDRLDVADIYFTIWTNQYPWVLVYSSPSSSNSSEDSKHYHKSMLTDPHFTGKTRRVIYDAIRRLQRALAADTSNSPKDYIDRYVAMPPMHQRDTRAVGRHSTLLITSMLPTMFSLQGVPWLWQDHFPFDSQVYKNPKDWDQLFVDQLVGTLDPDTALGTELLEASNLWVSSGYHLAVDDDPTTAWKTSAKKGDYFGIMTMGNGVPRTVSLLTDDNFDAGLLELSAYHQGQWLKCQVLDTQSESGAIHWRVECPGNDNELIHALRWTFKRDHLSMNIFGFSVNLLTV